jgi:hypothetical protein
MKSRSTISWPVTSCSFAILPSSVLATPFEFIAFRGQTLAYRLSQFTEPAYTSKGNSLGLEKTIGATKEI